MMTRLRALQRMTRGSEKTSRARRLPARFWHIAVAMTLVLTLASLAAPAQHSLASTRTSTDGPTTTYTNPVIPRTAPDPAIIKALDGYYYIVATSDTWQDGSFHLLPTWRSTDMVHWDFVGDAVPSRPSWVKPDAGLWAPDLQYFDHKYYMYYVASDTVAGGSAIGLFTAPGMTGPWTDAGGPIVGPRTCSFSAAPNCHPATIDPAVFTDQDGKKYMYFGSFFGGTLVQRLTDDGMHVTGPEYEIGHWDRYEGTYVIRHDVDGRAYYYNFSSAANCCAGPNTAYSVEVSRATSPLGPFYDQNGFPMQQPVNGSSPIAPTARPAPDPGLANTGAQGGGYPTLKQNGNKWDGVGHNAIITDLSGRDWIVYHGVDKTRTDGLSNGWVNSFPGPNPPKITYRQLLIDRIDWTKDGWPDTNGGKGPSDGPMPAPVTAPLLGNNFNASSGCGAPPFANTTTFTAVSGVLGASTDAPACVTGGFATIQGGLAVSTDAAPAGYRAECDLRLDTGAGRYGCVVSYRSEGATAKYIAAYLDPASNTLVTVLHTGNSAEKAQATALPATFDHTDWHHLTIEQHIGRAGCPTFRFVVSDRDRDPLAVQERTVSADFAHYGGAVGFSAAPNTRADVDNVTVAALDGATIRTPQVPPLGPELPAYSDEFNGSALGPQWSLVRPNPALYSVGNGYLSITVNGDLYRDANNAQDLVLETPPPGNYVIETKIMFDPDNNFQQAGLLVYSDDDHYIKVGPHHHFSLNKMLSGRETLEPMPGNAANCDVAKPAAGSNVAVTAYTRDLCPNEGEAWDYFTNVQPVTNGLTAADPKVTDYLRIYKRGDVYQPYVSVDGVNWVKGSAWTLTAVNAQFPIKIGLFAFAGGGPSNIPARFDYVRVYELGSSTSSSGTASAASSEAVVAGLLPLAIAPLFRRRRRHAGNAGRHR